MQTRGQEHFPSGAVLHPCRSRALSMLVLFEELHKAPLLLLLTLTSLPEIPITVYLFAIIID